MTDPTPTPCLGTGERIVLDSEGRSRRIYYPERGKPEPVDDHNAPQTMPCVPIVTWSDHDPKPVMFLGVVLP